MTQLASGEVRAVVTVISGSDGSVYHARVRAPGAGTFADLDAAYTGFVIPLAWDGRFVINGEDVGASSIYAPVDDTLFQVYGRNRETVAVALRRKEFVATIAALKGIDTTDVRLRGGSMEVPAAALARLRHSLASRLRDYMTAERRRALPAGAHETLTRSIVESVTDLYLHAQPAPTSRVRAAAKLGRIVRKAEERFDSAQFGPVSLADLCVAAGVSQGTLYNAFMVMCGDSPMAHFKKRRLTDARLALLEPKPNRRRVKSAALDAGLTHLGRFSAEYREIFGESPTTTLNRSSS
jgi:AraC-like DNA-binding protein